MRKPATPAAETEAPTTTTRRRRKTAMSAATTVPKTRRKRRTRAEMLAAAKPTKKRMGRPRKVAPVEADHVTIVLDIDGQPTSVSVAAAKRLYASLSQLFG